MSRSCGVCGKALRYYQKAACCRAHDAVIRTAPMARATGLGTRRCEVPGCHEMLTKKPGESWARFAKRRGHNRQHAAMLSAPARAVSISATAQARGLDARPERTARNWS